MLWQVNVGGDNCLFEMDPVTKVVTGNKICGPWDSPRRALAYDYATDTYYVAGVNDDVLYHLDSAGNLLDSVSTGLGIAGLAYNPTTRHLFAVTQGANPWDVWVFEPQAGYAVLGGFRVTDGGVPVLGFDAIGLEADCAGRLWLNTTDSDIVYSFESGETGWCVNDIPWLSENPTEGTISPSPRSRSPSRSTRTGLLPGLRQGSLIISTDTPTLVAPVPVDFTVLFNDVPQGSFAWNFIYGAAGAGVMPGCAPQTPTFNFCPDGSRHAAEHGGLHRASDPRRPDAAAGLSQRLPGRRRRQLQRQLHPGSRRRRDYRGLQRLAASLLPGHSGDARADGGLHVEGSARLRAAAGRAPASSTTCRARASSRTTSKGSTTRESPRAAATTTTVPTRASRMPRWPCFWSRHSSSPTW